MLGGIFSKKDKKRKVEIRNSNSSADTKSEDLGINAVPQDTKKIVKLADKKIELLNKVSKIDDEIIAIQRSTRTNIRALAPAHNALRMRFKWYYTWHLNRYANIIHYAILIAYIILLSVTFIFASNAGWSIAKLFRPDVTAYAASVNISGVCKQYDRTTNCADSEAVKVAVNGVISAVTTTTATGAWTLTGVTVNANDIVTVFIDNVADVNEANAVVKVAASPVSITGVALYERHLTLGASSNQTLINLNLSQYDNSVSTDEDIFFEVDASMNLTLPATGTQTAADQQLYLMASNPFNPNAAGGKIITVPNLNIPTSATLTAGANTYNITASGTPFTRAGTFTATGSTFNYIGSGATNITATTYVNLGVGTTADTGTGVTYTLAGNTTVSGVLTIGNAGSTNNDVLAGSSRVVTLSGSGTPFVVTAKGTFTINTSTINYTGTTATNVTGGITYYNLGVGTTNNSNVTTYTLAGDITVTNLITVGQTTTNALDTFALSDKTVTVTRAASSPFTVNTYGRFQADTSTVVYNLGSNVMSVAALAYYNLNITPTLTAARAYSTAGAVTVGGNFTLNPTASSAYALTFTLGGALTVTGSSTITKTTSATSLFETTSASNYAFSTGSLVVQTGGTVNLNTSTVTISGSGTPITNSGTLNYLTASFVYTGASPTNVVALNYKNLTINHAGVTFTAAGDMTISGVFTITTGTFDASSRTITLSGTGTPFVNNGTLTPSTSTFVYSGVGDTTVASTTYNNLETKPSADLTGWTVAGAGDTAYNGTYLQSGTFNGQPAYTYNGKWLYYNYDEFMCMCYNWVLYTSKTNMADVGMQATYYTGTTLPGTWYENFTTMNGPAPTLTAYSATPIYTFAAGTLDIAGNYVNGDGTHSVDTTAAANSPLVHVHGNFTNSAGSIYRFSTGDTYLSGNFTNATGATLGTLGSTVLLDGAALQTITMNGTDANHDFAALTITNASAAGVVFADSMTTATLVATTASSKITFTAGTTVRVANIVTNGQATGTRVSLLSSAAGSPWYLISTDATPTISNTSIKDSDASGGQGVEALTTAGNYDATGNTNWFFVAATPRVVSGTLFTSNLANSTTVSGKTIGLSVDGGVTTTVDTDGSGNYSFPSISLRDEAILVLFIKGETEKGSYIIKTGTITGDLTGLQFNVGYVKLDHLAGSEITNEMMELADNQNDADMTFVCTYSVITFADGLSVHVKTGKTYRPGGNVTADGVTIYGTLSLENRTLTNTGSFINEGTFSTSGSSVVNFTADSTGQTIKSNGSSFDHVAFNHASGGWSPSDAMVLNGDLTVTAGTLSGTENVTVNGGDVSGNGTINMTGGTFLVDGVGNFGGNANWTFSSLTFGDGTGSATTTKAGSGNVTSSGVLTIAANQTLSAGDDTWTLSGSGTPFVIGGTFQEGTSTFIYTGSSATNVTGTTYYKLTINQAGVTFTAAGDTTVANVFTITAGTFNASDKTITLSGNGTPFVNNGTLTPSTSTFKYTGAGATTVTAANYYHLEAIPSSQPSGWTIAGAGDTSYNGTYTASGTLNGQTKYTNGSRWLFYNWADMMGSNHWGLYSSASNCGDPAFCLAYYQWPNASLPGTWYSSEGYTGTLSFNALTAYNYTLSAGTFNITGNYTNGSQSVAVSMNADTNDPIFNVDGNFLNETGSTFTASASAGFSVASNFTNNGKLTDSAGTLTFDGQGLQTITAGGTDADHDFTNLTVTNASVAGVSFADSATVTGTFTDVTASSKLTFHAGSTYAFANININGQASGTRVILKSSTDTQHWHLNVTQASPSVSYVSARDSDASGGNGISAVIGSSDGTGNTNWTFSGTEITVSGTVYTAENKSTNIGANKTVRIVINGDAGSSTTVSTTEGGSFSFGGIVLSTNNPVLVYLSGEAEKASLITQAATATNDITGLELYTNHVVLTHESAGPLTNAVIGTAIAATDTDNLMTIDGSSNVTFSVLDNIETWIQGGKTYTPGAEAYFGSLDILSTATFNPENNLIAMNDSGTPFAINGTFNVAGSTVLYQGLNATNVTATTYNNLKVSHTGATFTAAGNITVSGVFTIEAGTFDASDKTITLSGAGTPFVNTGTLTASTSTFKYTGAGATTVAAADYYNLETIPASAPAGGGGWIVGGTLSDPSYTGTYTASGTANGYAKYTNGSKWLFYNFAAMDSSYQWALSSSASDCGDPYMCLAYYQYPGASVPNSGTWYTGMDFTGSPTFAEAASSYVHTFASGTFNIAGNYTNGTASVTVETNATTNDPIINIDGNFSNLAGSTFIASNSAAFSVASHFTNSGTGKFTDSGGTLTLDGQGLQTITAGGTTANFDFTNLTITNADSTNGVSFADSVTVTGTFTDVTASSKVTFHSGSTYAFNAININGQATATRVTLTSSSSGSAWNLNITEASPTASNISVKDSNANKDIDATTGGYDGTGNTHWLFPVTVYLSGTVYTAENKSTNIGANKTIALSINGGTIATDETDSSGIFRFDDITIGTNNPVTVFISGETEKGSLVTIAANTAAITSLELFTNRVVLTHHSAGPMSNSVLTTADNACTADCLFSVDGSSVATFASASEVFVPTTKTYTPGAAIIADDIEIDGTLTLAGNAATIHGSWDSADGFFSSSGTVTFNAASGTETLNTGGVGGDGGWTVTNSPGDSSYGGNYTPSGTFNSQPTYTNGSKWLYYNYDEMGMSYYWVMYTSVTNLMDAGMSAGYYDGATLPGTWYENWNLMNGPAPTLSAVTAHGGSFTNITKSGGGTLQLASNAIDIDGTLSISSSTTFDINGQNITLATLSNDGTLKLQGAETATITSLDTNSGTVEYSGTSTYSSLLLGDTYAGLKINGTGGVWTLDADLSVSGILDINAGTLNASSRTITLSGSGTPFVVTGTFSEGASTVIYTGSSATNVAGSTYKNLKLNHAGTTFTAAGDTLVKSVFTIEAGTFNASNRTITLSGSGTPFVKTGTFVASTSTIAYTSPYDTNVTAADYYHLDLIDPPEWLAGWNKRVKVEVLDTNIDSDLTNFPLMLRLGASVGTGSDDTTAVFDEVGSNSKKIAVTATDGTTEIYVEIEKWDNVGEEAILWVSKSDLVFSGSATTDLYLYYDNNHADNTTYVGTTGSRPEVWDSSYTAVYHSNQATDAQMLDSTGDHNATPGKTSGSNPVSTTSGKIGSAFTYNSTDQRRYVTDIVSGTTYTWEVWANASVFNNYHSMLSLSGNYVLFDLAGNALSAWASDGMGGNDGGITGLSTDTFYRMVFIRTADNTTGGYKFYKDGVASGTSYNTGAWSNANPIYIGSRQDTLSQAFDGKLDEVRISSAVRSAAWLKADYYSQTDGLVNWGTEEGAPGSAVYTMGSGTFNIEGDLTIGNSTDEMSVNADTNDPIVNVNGSMEITANSTFVASGSASFSVASNFSNSGIFTDSAGTLTLDGQGLQTITAGGTDGNHDFHNLETTNASAAGVSFADSATVAGTFTDVTPSSKVTFLSGGTYAFNAININGQATGTRITLTSSNSGTPWNLNITAASPTASNVSVKDSNANKDIDATTGGEDLTGNTHWLFPVVGATISGTVYTVEDKSTNIGANKTIALSVNGAAVTTVESSTGGAFSFSNITVAADNTVAIFIDEETEKGSFITQASGAGDISGIEMFSAHIILSHQTAGPMTNTLLDTADNVSDTDLLVSVSTSNATFTAGNEVWIISAKTYTPGGSSSVDDIKVAGTLTMGTNALTISGNLSNSGTISTTGSTTFNSTASSKTVTSGGASLGSVTFNGVGGEWTLQDNFSAASVTMTNGRLYDNTKTVTVNGSIMLADVANLLTSTGSWVMAGTGSIKNFISGASYTSNIFNDLTINSNVTADINLNLNVRKITIEDSASLTGSSSNIHIYPTASSFFTQGTNDNIGISSISVLKHLGDQNITLEQGRIDAPNTSLILAYGTGVVHKMMASWTVGSLKVEGGGSDDTEVEATTLDTNGQNLTVNGNLIYGETRTGITNGFHAKILFGSGTHSIIGDLKANITGATDTHGYLYFGTSNISVGGSVNLLKTTVDAGTGTVHLNGSAAQTITSNSNSFSNFTITNASTAGVTFADSATVAGTFTDVTPSSKATFNSGSTYAFNAININGQATSTRVTLNSSSAGTPWNLNITASSPTASNVSVKDSNANKDIDATTGGEDLTGNTHWIFSTNSTPANDSLTFANPYSSNIAVSDNTTPWNFTAQVSDSDQATDLDYVELRLANSADSTQPYDSLKFRWTESTGTFSKIADTQNAATIDGTSSATKNGATATINFKIKFNSSFLANDANYAAELYSIDDAATTDSDDYSNLFQVSQLSLNLSVDSGTFDFGSLLPGSVITGSTTATVTTNFPNGYSLSAHDGVSSSNSALLHTDTSTRIADYLSSISLPTSWNGNGFGICVVSATGKDTNKWGTGTTAGDSNNKYAGVPETATVLHSKAGSPTTSNQTIIGYKLVVPNTQKTGSYQGIITYTATGVLN